MPPATIASIADFEDAIAKLCAPLGLDLASTTWKHTPGKPGLIFRLVATDTDQVIIVQHLDTTAMIEAAAEYSADLALDLGDRPWRLEVMDPDGDLAPAGRWMPVVINQPMRWG